MAKRRRLSGRARQWRRYDLAPIHGNFASKYGIGCFICGDTQPSEWAKTGFNRRGPWAVCGACVKRRRLQSG